MFVIEVLVREVSPVDGLATCAILVGYIATLYHEMRDDPMDYISFIV